MVPLNRLPANPDHAERSAKIQPPPAPDSNQPISREQTADAPLPPQGAASAEEPDNFRNMLAVLSLPVLQCFLDLRKRVIVPMHQIFFDKWKVAKYQQ